MTRRGGYHDKLKVTTTISEVTTTSVSTKHDKAL